MILLNPHYFASIRKGQICSINPQYMINTRIPQPRRDVLLSRVGCLMEAKKICVAGAFPARDKVILECVGSVSSCLRQKHGELELSRIEVDPLAVSTAGSLLVRIFSEVCHACGNFREDCWRDWVGHFICKNCRLMGHHQPPYDYGTAVPRCCNRNVCGSKQDKIGDEKDLVLYDQVVKVYERYRW